MAPAQGWWWERAGVLSDGGDEDERFTWAVCAASVLRNLALTPANQPLLAEPACLSVLVGHCWAHFLSPATQVTLMLMHRNWQTCK